MLAAILAVYQAVLKAIGRHPYNENLVAEIFDANLKNALANLKYKASPEEIVKTYQELVQNIDQI
jgi:hypothetical protein